MATIDWTSFGILQGEGASEDSIAEVERRIGCPLPAAYVDLARFRNGASPEIAAFRFGDDETCISDFFEITSSPDLFSVLWYLRPGAISNLPLKFLPIARDARDGLICLNYAVMPPTVEFLDQDTGVMHFISDSFESFVADWYE